MARDPTDLSDMLRSLADGIDDHSYEIELFMDKVISSGSSQAESLPDADKLAEVHENEDQFMLIAEVESGLSQYGVEKADDEIFMYAGDEVVSGRVRGDVNMDYIDVIVQNGVMRVIVPKEENDGTSE